MKKKLFAVAMGAVLGSSFLMADIDDVVGPDAADAIEFVLEVVKMAENGDMNIVDYYSEKVSPSVAGLPLTQEELKDRILKGYDNGKPQRMWIFPYNNVKIDSETIEMNLRYSCAGINEDPGNTEPRGFDNKPLIISIEDGKYRIKSMPQQTQGVCEEAFEAYKNNTRKIDTTL